MMDDVRISEIQNDSLSLTKNVEHQFQDQILDSAQKQQPQVISPSATPYPGSVDSDQLQELQLQQQQSAQQQEQGNSEPVSQAQPQIKPLQKRSRSVVKFLIILSLISLVYCFIPVIESIESFSIEILRSVLFEEDENEADSSENLCKNRMKLNKQNICVEKCDEFEFSQNGECVDVCFVDQFQISSECINPNCPASPIRRNNSTNYYDDQNELTPPGPLGQSTTTTPSVGFYSFSEEKCVQKCKHNELSLFDRFCFEGVCPRETVVDLFSQYLNKTESKVIPQYDSAIATYSQVRYIPQSRWVITTDLVNKTCEIGCFETMRRTKKQMFIKYDEEIGIYTCNTSCDKSIYFYKDYSMIFCFEKCPMHLMQASTGYQCVDSCQDNQFAHKQKCVDSCPENTFAEGMYCYDVCTAGTFLLIQQQGQYHENELERWEKYICVSNCENYGKFVFEDKCVQGCPEFHKVYKNVCTLQCPPGSIFNPKNQRCEDECSDGWFKDISKGECVEHCQFVFQEDNICANSCRKNQVQYNNRCITNNYKYPWKFLNESGQFIDDCPINDGYYSSNRVCMPCRNNCKRCTQQFGVCVKCQPEFKLYQYECVSDCPLGFVDVDSVCVSADVELVAKNVRFREIKAKNMKNEYLYSVLKDARVEPQSNKVCSQDDYQMQYACTPTIIVHLQDLNATYVDVYQHSDAFIYNRSNSSAFYNIRQVILEEKATFITVQQDNSQVFFSEFYDFLIDELLPELGFHSGRLMFSGIGTGANSIQSALIRKFYSENGVAIQSSFSIYGVYMIDAQLEIGQNADVLQELSNEELQEIKLFFGNEAQLFSGINLVCAIFNSYFSVADVSLMEQPTSTLSTTHYESMTQLLVAFYNQRSCYTSTVKPLYSIEKFIEKRQNIDAKPIHRLEYLSEKRRINTTQEMSENMFTELIGWINYDDQQQFMKDML